MADSSRLAALLLTDQGRGRADTDLIFYNQPTGTGVRLVPGQTSMSVTLSAIPPGIACVRIVIALDDQTSRLGDYPPPYLTVADTAGNLVYEYVIDGLTSESTAIALDLDRTPTGWRSRALGHGYPPGFAGLLTAHGVTISTTLAPNPTEPGIAAVLWPGDDATLRKHGGGDLTYVKLALGWDPIQIRSRWGARQAEIDLDASALVFADRDLVDAAYFGQLSTRDGAIRHSGDNLTGEGEGDDEVIAVDLTRLPVHVTAIVFVITSYAGHTFERVRNAFWRLVDGTTNAEITRANLSAGGPHTGMVVANVHREHGIWKIQALGHQIQAKHPVEAAAQVTPYL